MRVHITRFYCVFLVFYCGCSSAGETEQQSPKHESGANAQQHESYDWGHPVKPKQLVGRQWAQIHSISLADWSFTDTAFVLKSPDGQALPRNIVEELVDDDLEVSRIEGDWQLIEGGIRLRLENVKTGEREIKGPVIITISSMPNGGRANRINIGSEQYSSK